MQLGRKQKGQVVAAGEEIQIFSGRWETCTVAVGEETCFIAALAAVNVLLSSSFNRGGEKQ